MNEPYLNCVLRRFGILRIAVACLTFLFVQAQAFSGVAYSSDSDFQQRLVRGVVTDENGVPFPFVNVYVEGNITIGVTTNDKGEYRLTVPPNSILVFAFVGYKEQKIPVGVSELLDVRMIPEMKAIDEVVVIGYGEQRKASVSASVSTVKATDIVSTPVANVSQALAGRLPGLTSMQSSGEPGNDQATFYVRGVGTWNDALPLYVIDGVERNATIFRSMSPEEIESVSILKDASATAVYGSKGANGVILITTKRGSQGAPAISITTGYTMQQFTRFPQYLDSYNSLVLMNEAYMNDGQNPIYSDEDLLKYQTQSDPARYPNTDWYKELMLPYAPMSNTNFNVSGGSRTVAFFVSGGFQKQEGHLRAAKNPVYDSKYSNKLYRFSSNVDAYVTKSFKLSFEMAGTFRDKEDPYADDVFDNMNRLGPWRMPAKNPNGSYAATNEFTEMNPVYLMDTRGVDRMLGNYITSSVKINLDLGDWIKGLVVSGRVSYDSDFQNYKAWSETQNTYELISRQDRADRYRSYLTRVYYSSTTTIYTPTKGMDALGSIAYKTKVKEHNMEFSVFSTINERLTGYNAPYRSVSFIGRANYSFKNRYNLDINAAYRGNENFAPGKRFGLFPSVSASWNINDENFIKAIPFITQLKLRAGYGKTGAEYAATRFLYKEGKWATSSSGSYYFGSGNGSSKGSSTEPSIANPDATWESAESVNLGLDFGIWRDKLSGSFDIWEENREGILQTSNSFSGSLGIGVPALNIGKTTRHGWEFELAYTQQLGSDLRLSIRPNIAYWQNKIVFADDPVNQDWWLKTEGFPISQPTGYVVLGYFKDQEDIANSPAQQVGSVPIPGDFKYLDFNGDGVINQFDVVPVSQTAVPNISGGLTFNVDYKSLSASAHFQAATMSSVMVSQYLYWEFYNRAPVMEHHLGRWTRETAETATYPVLHNGSVSQNHVNNSFWRNDNSYLRLKTVNLMYRVPQSVVTKLRLKGLSLTLSGGNLITWSKFKMLDPEVATGTATRYYPQSKTYSATLRLNF